MSIVFQWKCAHTDIKNRRLFFGTKILIGPSHFSSTIANQITSLRFQAHLKGVRRYTHQYVVSACVRVAAVVVMVVMVGT
jgi:hypothetical protein